MKKASLFAKIGCWTLLLTAVLHTLAVLAGFLSPSPGPAEEELFRVLKGYAPPQPGPDRSAWEILGGLHFSLSIFTFVIGLACLLALRKFDTGPAARWITGYNALLWGLIAAISIFCFPLPPLVLYTFSFGCFLVSWTLQPK